VQFAALLDRARVAGTAARARPEPSPGHVAARTPPAARASPSASASTKRWPRRCAPSPTRAYGTAPSGGAPGHGSSSVCDTLAPYSPTKTMRPRASRRP
jgi:hypothetical protein